MKLLLVLLLMLCCAPALLAQESSSDSLLIVHLRKLRDLQQYDDIINLYAPKSANYPARALSLIGIAYYMKSDNANCIVFMDRTIQKDSTRVGAYFYKGMTLNYMDRYDDAIKCFAMAVRLDSNDGMALSGMGDSYYNLKNYPSALAAYQHATRCPDPPDRAYSMIAQVYSDEGKDDLALEANYAAKGHVDKTSDDYHNALYNIGLMESLRGNYEKAEGPLRELIRIAPNDFHPYAKMIQVYYALREYDKVKPYRAKLYEAHSKGLLKESLADMFCFDQFLWKDKRIMAFERYQDTGKFYPKHLFIVTKDNQEEFKVQTEYDFITDANHHGKYLLCEQKGDTHYTFNIRFNDDFKYDELKDAVLQVLDEKVQPAASSN